MFPEELVYMTPPPGLSRAERVLTSDAGMPGGKKNGISYRNYNFICRINLRSINHNLQNIHVILGPTRKFGNQFWFLMLKNEFCPKTINKSNLHACLILLHHNLNRPIGDQFISELTKFCRHVCLLKKWMILWFWAKLKMYLFEKVSQFWWN